MNQNINKVMDYIITWVNHGRNINRHNAFGSSGYVCWYFDRYVQESL